MISDDKTVAARRNAMEYDIISEMLEHAEYDTSQMKLEKSSRDYLGYYGFEKEPFRDSIDPSFFYRTQPHEEAYSKMLFTIEHDISLGMIHSRAGMGKTLLSQLILTNLDEARTFARLILVTPRMSRSALVAEIASELGLISDGHHYSTKDLLAGIQNFAIEQLQVNKKLVLLIDEAHFLSSEALHVLRTLSNIELPSKKIVSCLLFSENSLAQRLEKDVYSSIRSRMYHIHELRPLTEQETIQYIKYRLLMSGAQETVFTPEVYKGLARKSRGICREINKTATLALYDGFIAKCNPVTTDIFHDGEDFQNQAQ